MTPAVGKNGFYSDLQNYTFSQHFALQQTICLATDKEGGCGNSTAFAMISPNASLLMVVHFSWTLQSCVSRQLVSLLVVEHVVFVDVETSKEHVSVHVCLHGAFLTARSIILTSFAWQAFTGWVGLKSRMGEPVGAVQLQFSSVLSVNAVCDSSTSDEITTCMAIHHVTARDLLDNRVELQKG